MDSGKLDNQLSLALSATEGEREKTGDLEVGFQPQTRQWELIIRYEGDILSIAEELAASVTVLMNGYAILLIDEDKIPALTEYEEIIFIEKPKRLFFAVNQGKAASCITPVQRPPLSLTGENVLVGMIDSG